MPGGTDQGSQTSASALQGWLDLVGRHRLLVSVLIHAFLFAFSLLVAFGLAYNFHETGLWFTASFLPLLAVALPIKLAVCGRLGLFRGSWRYVGLRDLMSIAAGSQISSFLLISAWWAIETLNRGADRPEVFGVFRQSVFLIDWAGTIALVSAARVVVRSCYEFARGHGDTAGSAARVAIVGAGDSAEMVLREILRTAGEYEVVGLIDDNVTQLKQRIHGVEVIGRTAELKDICERYAVDEILIAIPEARPREIRRVVELCRGNSLRFRTIPAVTDLIEGRVEVNQIRPVVIEDLLGREPVKLDTEAIGRELTGKRIAVTGGGGSIGSEMCRQISRFAPEQLILIEQAENNLFEINNELREKHRELNILPVIADVCDQGRVRTVFGEYRPHVVFHAAAHKHVPMMEINPGEAVKNNVVGTRTIALAAAEFGVQKVVMISTDKAVNPTSVMGCSKRVAEIFVQQFGSRCSTQFVTVRFGNVLGSSGSVVPIFTRQIARGGPVTVTHPEMTRYFMTIPEASQLVLQAGAMGQGGEIYVLNMGDPVKIVDLARDMITLSGLRAGEDIEIVFTGMRPGEKLFEELLIDGEHVSATSHPKIGIWRRRPEDWDRLLASMEELITLADRGSPDAIRGQLGRIVPEYQPGGAEPNAAVKANPRSRLTTSGA